MEYSPIEIFAHILLSRPWKEFRGGPKEIHSVFYDITENNPSLKGHFKFLKRTNPYSPTVEELLTLLQLSGAVSRNNPNYLKYNIVRDRLEQLLPENVEDLPELNNLEPLDRLDCGSSGPGDGC